MAPNRIHTYRSKRMRLGFEGDLSELSPPLRMTVEQDRAVGLGWRQDGLASWPTEEIVAKLQELSVDVDPIQLREQASQEGTVEALERKWRGNGQYSGAWADFPLLAAEELWYRLLPDLACPEIASRQLDEAILASAPESISIPADRAGRQTLWKAVADFIQYATTGATIHCPKRYLEAQECSPIDYETIVLDLIKSADAEELELNGGTIDKFLLVKPNPLILGCLAVTFARSGHTDRARHLTAANLRRFPDDAWAHELAGEVQIVLVQLDWAIESFRSALRYSGTAMNWGCLLDHMLSAVSRDTAGNETATMNRALDQLAEEVPPQED